MAKDSSYFNFDGDAKTTLTKEKTRRRANVSDNMNGSLVEDNFILPSDQEVYLSLLPISQSGGAGIKAGSAAPVFKAPAGTTPGGAVSPATAPIGAPAQAPTSVPPLPTQSQVNAMSCAQLQAASDTLAANIGSYQSPPNMYIQYQQIALLISQKLAACNQSGPASPAPATSPLKPAAIGFPVISVVAPSSVTLPDNNVTLDASGSTDPNGGTLTFLWSLVSGPNAPTISGQNGSVASVNSLVPGNYIFQVTVTNAAGSRSQNVNLSVLPAPATTVTTDSGTVQSSGATIIATTAPVSVDSLSPLGVDAGPAGGAGGGGGGGPVDSSGNPTTDTGTVIAGVIIPMWAQWLGVALIVAGGAYLIFGKDE